MQILPAGFEFPAELFQPERAHSTIANENQSSQEILDSGNCNFIMYATLIHFEAIT